MSTHLIPRSDIQIDESKPLGQGGFGVVFKGTRRGGSHVAVKRLLPGLTAQSRAAFQKEVAIMCSMRSEFVVPVYGIVDDSPDQPVLIVMKLMHESLHSAYSSVPAPSLWQRIKWLVQAGKGIEFIHAQSVLHRDIKPANMLISSPQTGRCLELSDFGLSKNLKDITSASVRSTNPLAAVLSAVTAGGLGTPHYMAPELMSVPPVYSFKSDVYAFGIVMREVICMQIPFADCDDMHALKKAIRKTGFRESFPADFPPAMKAVVERAWHQDPTQRPAIGEVVRELEQYLGHLRPDISGGGDDSRQPFPPRDSSVIDAQHFFAHLSDSDFALLVDSAGPDFNTKGYGQAALKKNVKGSYILRANEVELSTLFGQMNVDAGDMPTLREAFVSWKANPVQAVVCIEREKKAAALRQAQSERKKQAEQKRQAEEQTRWKQCDGGCNGTGMIRGRPCTCPDQPASPGFQFMLGLWCGRCNKGGDCYFPDGSVRTCTRCDGKGKI
jgi:serine/threonine protein kinase